ncbi:MAG TPA: ACT domain-containing protein, partial [Methanocorpusculum sp.]|nr:ACT domain-containing protein [Methanocorpusculum sp.]
MDKNEYYLKQLSIFSENKSGRFAAISKILKDNNINIHAFSIAEANNNFGIVRTIVDKPDVAFNA